MRNLPEQIHFNNESQNGKQSRYGDGDDMHHNTASTELTLPMGTRHNNLLPISAGMSAQHGSIGCISAENGQPPGSSRYSLARTYFMLYKRPSDHIRYAVSANTCNAQQVPSSAKKKTTKYRHLGMSLKKSYSKMTCMYQHENLHQLEKFSQPCLS